MAATFVNLDTGKAFRVVSTEEARSLANAYTPEIVEKYRQQLEAYKRMPDSVLFRVQQVRMLMDECDLPGPTRYKAACSRCGQVVRDQREVIKNKAVLCKPCAQDSYFSDAREVTWPDMNWKPDSSLTQTRTPCEQGEAGVGRQNAKITETNCD
jgi:formylmethanofuran dehydrogenase subunit E